MSGIIDLLILNLSLQSENRTMLTKVVVEISE